MLESLFGAEMPLAVRFFVAFLIVLGLIGAIAWAVRRFGSGRLGTSTRGRQPRLAVIDYASVDGRRRLILVRRDNVEHLLMIGGPSDIVVEPNIVRAAPAGRDIGRAPAGVEALTRAIPLPESGGTWPLQPESNGGARPASRNGPPHEDLPGRPQPETAARQRDTLAALADELSTRGTPPPRNRGNLGEPPRQEQRQEPRQEPREPRFEARKPVPGSPTPASSGPAAAEGAGPTDQSLADMAQRLEAALRKPPSEPRQAGARPMPPATEQTGRSDSLPPPPPRPARAPESKPEARPEQRPAATESNKPNQGKTAIYDTLEQEMANLLGRPGKN
jgi:flagellar protein FliO/FliZ